MKLHDKTLHQTDLPELLTEEQTLITKIDHNIKEGTEKPT